MIYICFDHLIFKDQAVIKSQIYRVFIIIDKNHIEILINLKIMRRENCFDKDISSDVAFQVLYFVKSPS